MRKSKLRIVNARTVDQWVELIQSQWRDSVKGIMDVGLSLYNSRDELETKVFWQMVHDRLKYAESTVFQLIKMGTNKNLLDCDMSQLPAAWGTLYALARLTDEQFQRGLDDGVIHAGMQRKDIAQLKPPKDNPGRKTEPALTGRELIEHRMLETRKQIVAVLRELDDAEQLEFIALIRLQLDDLENSKKAGA